MNYDIDLSLILAVSENNVIGLNEVLEDGRENFSLPWPRIPTDMKHFENKTKGYTVISGPKTYMSLPKKVRPLPDRKTIVLTRKRLPEKYQNDDILIANSIDEALEMARDEKIYGIGGSSIYESLFPFANTVELTRIHENFEGNVYFPKIDLTDWKEVNIDRKKDEKTGYELSFITYTRN